MSKLLRLILGFGIGATLLGAVSMRLVVRMRQRVTVLRIGLSAAGAGELQAGSAERCADIVKQRIGYLKSRYCIERFDVRLVSPDLLQVELLTHMNVSPVRDLLLKRYTIELRLVQQYDFDAAATQDVPPTAQVLDEVQQFYSLQEIGKVEVRRTPRLVAKDPELVIDRLASAKFTTLGLRRSPIILIEMLPHDAARFAEITRRHVGKHLAVVIDGEIKTAPLVEAPITGGRAEIHGVVFKQEARDMAAFLSMGSLPCVASLRSTPVKAKQATGERAAEHALCIPHHGDKQPARVPVRRVSTKEH